MFIIEKVKVQSFCCNQINFFLSLFQKFCYGTVYYLSCVTKLKKDPHLIEPM